jgi:hypothetical protein
MGSECICLIPRRQRTRRRRAGPSEDRLMVAPRYPRSDGSTQATYGGHPLFTYVADTGPRASQWQQPQPERWPVARSHRDLISPRQNTVATPALTPKATGRAKPRPRSSASRLPQPGCATASSLAHGARLTQLPACRQTGDADPRGRRPPSRFAQVTRVQPQAVQRMAAQCPRHRPAERHNYEQFRVSPSEDSMTIHGCRYLAAREKHRAKDQAGPDQHHTPRPRIYAGSRSEAQRRHRGQRPDHPVRSI